MARAKRNAVNDRQYTVFTTTDFISVISTGMYVTIATFGIYPKGHLLHSYLSQGMFLVSLLYCI